MNVLLLQMQVVQGLPDREEAVSHTIQKLTEQTRIVRGIDVTAWEATT